MSEIYEKLFEGTESIWEEFRESANIDYKKHLETVIECSLEGKNKQEVVRKLKDQGLTSVKDVKKNIRAIIDRRLKPNTIDIDGLIRGKLSWKDFEEETPNKVLTREVPIVKKPLEVKQKPLARSKSFSKINKNLFSEYEDLTETSSIKEAPGVDSDESIEETATSVIEGHRGDSNSAEAKKLNYKIQGLKNEQINQMKEEIKKKYSQEFREDVNSQIQELKELEDKYSNGIIKLSKDKIRLESKKKELNKNVSKIEEYIQSREEEKAELQKQIYKNQELINKPGMIAKTVWELKADNKILDAKIKFLESGTNKSAIVDNNRSDGKNAEWLKKWESQPCIKDLEKQLEEEEKKIAEEKTELINQISHLNEKLKKYKGEKKDVQNKQSKYKDDSVEQIIDWLYNTKCILDDDSVKVLQVKGRREAIQSSSSSDDDSESSSSTSSDD